MEILKLLQVVLRDRLKGVHYFVRGALVLSITPSGRAAKTSVVLMHYPGLKVQRTATRRVPVRCTFISELGTDCYRRFSDSAAGRLA